MPVSVEAGLFCPAGGNLNGRKLLQATMNRSRLQIFYSGRVQGVGFRYTVKMLASGFELTGTVRNMTDGRVELTAEGEQDELKAFQTGDSRIGAGPFYPCGRRELECRVRNFSWI